MKEFNTLYLHVGHGKTGTKYIQKLLGLNTHLLQKSLIYYDIIPDEYPEYSERLSAGNGRNLFDDHAYIHLLLEQTLRNKCKSTIVSSEYLFNLFHENKSLFLEKLDEFTELGFKKIEILLFVRNPFSMMLSSYKQSFKIPAIVTNHIDIANFDTIENYIIWYLEQVDSFIQHFKDKPNLHLTILNYEKVKNDLITNIATWLNLESDLNWELPNTPLINRSLTAGELHIVQKIKEVIPEMQIEMGLNFSLYSNDFYKDELTISHLKQREVVQKLANIVSRVNMNIPDFHAIDMQPVGVDSDALPNEYTFTKDQINVLLYSFRDEIYNQYNRAQELNSQLIQLEQKLKKSSNSIFNRLFEKIKMK
jgi:hypothetical protein